jgi:CBS domain-containing protein
MNAARVARVPVRSRQIHFGDGSSVTDFTVHCPLRKRSIDLDDCSRCGGYEGVAETRDHAPVAVSCARVQRPPFELLEPVEALVRGHLARTPVAAVMCGDVVCVQPDVAVETVAQLLVERDIGGVPVVDVDFRPIGVMSKTDLVRRDVAEVPGSTVEKTMTRSVSCIGESASVLDAAAAMTGRHIHRLPVVAHDGRIVGVVTTFDVLRWLAGDRLDETAAERV